MVWGYARCSTNDTKQDIDRQVRDLIILGVQRENIYLEYQSGLNADRLQLNKLFQQLAVEDTVISTEVSRITRSTKQLCEIVELAKSKRLCLIFGSFRVDCRYELDPMTEGMLKMMGVFSELERNMISQRVKSGMASAKDKGKRIGRKRVTIDDIPSLFFRHYPHYKSGLINKKELARLCRISYPTVYKYLLLIDNKL